MHRGYCLRCYPIIYRISRIDRGLYRRRGRWAHRNPTTTGIRKNAQNELEEIRELEAPVKHGASGTDIENLLATIAEHVRAKPERFEGVRYFFDGTLIMSNEHESMKSSFGLPKICRAVDLSRGGLCLSNARFEKTQSLMLG